MHFRHAQLALLFAVCAADMVLARDALRIRQDAGNSASAAAAAPASGSSTVSTANTKDGTPKTAQTATSNGKGGITSSVTVKSTSTPKANGTADASDELPIQPSITPAVGIAGIVLILTGVAYTLIGIKHEWLLVFLSSAYLASLGVTVLIIYVMTPPVSNTIQGAYFVAAFMTGALFGGLALLFKEIAGGFGCLVGGFCLSMWLLCLKPGGLVTSTTGRALMIGVLSAVSWSLAFSKHTRNYGSLFCTSFGGAMITIIGIDCFTRAGLKEFWIYIWNLNDDEFPLHTTTYPITRGMRAELACTIVLCILGLISQMKVWKMVKERRAKKEEERMQIESDRDKRDSQYGRAIELRNSRSLAAWEAVYGDNNTDSEIATTVDTLKKSASVRERELASVELEELDASGWKGRIERNSSGMRGGAKDNEAASSATELGTDLEYGHGHASSWDEHESSNAAPGESERDSFSRTNPPAPTIPPLPFSPHIAQDRAIASSSESSHFRARPAPTTVEATSSKVDKQIYDDQSSFDIERIEDDRASSVAATLDEEPDFDALSTKRFSQYSLAASLHAKGPPQGSLDEIETPRVPAMPGEESKEENDNEELIQPLSSIMESNPRQGEGGVISKQKQKAENVAELNDTNLPPAMSKVAHVYRTNEWAKHVAEAEKPETIEEGLNSDEPAVHVDVGRTEEAPRPLDPRALSPEQVQPQFFRTASNPYRRHSREQKRPPSTGTPIYAFSRQGSNASLNQATRDIRSMAKSPVPETLIEAPSEDGFESTDNLMDERNLRMQSRTTTANFNGITSPSPTPSLGNLITPQSASVQAHDRRTSTPADLPYAQRLSLTPQGHLSPEPHPFRSSSALSHQPIIYDSYQPLIYDSHQPKRFSSVNQSNQSAMLTQWRRSLQQDSPGQPSMPAAGLQARQSMIEHHRLQKRETERKRRESQREFARRRESLAERHQSLMRKMQAQVNEGL